jgi:hypothetical protein
MRNSVRSRRERNKLTDVPKSFAIFLSFFSLFLSVSNFKKLISLTKKTKKQIFLVEKESQLTNMVDYRPLWMIIVQCG